jgi:hypothetical protein
MNWILLGIFIYTLIGSLLASLNMRGLHVQAKAGEWLILIFLWPFSLKFYAQLAIVQSMIQNLEQLEENQEK